MCGLGAYAHHLLITKHRPDSRQEQKKERGAMIRIERTFRSL